MSGNGCRSVEHDIEPTGETCHCGGRILELTCPTCDAQYEYCEACGETESEKLHREEVERLTKELDELRSESKHDSDMLGTLLYEAERESRYMYGAVEARNAYARGNRNQPWLANMCSWCQHEDGQHTDECPEQQWPTRRPRRRERTGRPLRLLLAIPGIRAGVKTCRDLGWRCPFLGTVGSDDRHYCMVGVALGWMTNEWLKHTVGENHPVRCDGCFNAEE